MPTLAQSLHGQDLTHLHIIADLWGVELRAPDLRRGREILAKNLLVPDLIHEIIESLPEDAKKAVALLIKNQGRIPWGQFARAHGQIREMGSARRDRDQPYFNPESTAEFLFYRALVARAFFNTADGPKEFAYLADDLLSILAPQQVQSRQASLLGRPATPAERNFVHPSNDAILDLATSLLANLRNRDLEAELENFPEIRQIPKSQLQLLLQELGLVDKNDQPDRTKAKIFLEAPRAEALSLLSTTWQESQVFNDLFNIPDLLPEGSWKNDPLKTRQAILSLLSKLETNVWWNLPVFITAIYQQSPDFQRSGGEYDAWYIKDQRNNQFLRGYEHWQAIEGELIRYMITGPLHWLGILDLAAPEKDIEPLAFRFSDWAADLLSKQIPLIQEPEEQTIFPNANMIIGVPRHASRTMRYQIARFSEFLSVKKDIYQYRITPQSLNRARDQGLSINHLLPLLKKSSKNKLPPNLTQSLERWEKYGTQAQFEQALILRVKKPEILASLRASRAKRFLGDPLGPTSIIVKPGAWENVVNALNEMGYLNEILEREM